MPSPFPLAFSSTVSALCYAIIQHRVGEQAGRDFPHNRTVRFVIEQHGRMPDYLRLPIWLLTLVFDGAGIFTGRKLFHQLSDRLRWQQIEAWRNSRLSPCRDLIKFYESLVIYYCYAADS